MILAGRDINCPLMFAMGVEQRQKSTKITTQQNKQEPEKQCGQQEVPSPMHKIRKRLINRRNAAT